MSSQRSLLIVALVAVAGLLGLWLTRRAPAPAPPPPVVAKATASPVAVVVAPTPDATPARREVRTETLLDVPDESQMTAEQAAAAAARYRKAARFPRTSRSLEEGLDPINTSRAPNIPNKDKDWKSVDPRLFAYPSITNFEAPGDVVIYAEAVELRMAPGQREDGKAGRERLQHFRVGVSGMRGVMQTMDGIVVAQLAFHDDATHGDAQADDDYWTATFTPDPDRPKEFRGQYQVVVQAETKKGAELMATTGFVYSVPIAHLTGQYRDSVVDGNLRIEAELEVEEAGRFRVEGTLVRTADAKMIAHGYAEVDLQPGTAWVPITYYGLIFHDMKADGPYSMFSTMLSTLGGDVAQESDVIPNAHTTKAYKVSDFGDQPFNDPEYMQKAQHYDDIRRAKQQ